MASALAAGSSIGPYRVRSRLGQGGMGVVYLADDTRLGRKVALKLLPANVTADAGRLKRFEQEARAASALNHPNILTIFEVGHADGEHYIAAEYVEGETLRQRLGRGRLPLKDALDVALQVGTALAAAHKAGIVHRDVKPENVILRPDGYAKVLDFGLAKLSEPPARGSEESPTLARIETDPGTVLGTATYMSPEQACGDVVDARSDIFSLGVVLYEMLAGAPPFRGASTAETMAGILKTEPEPLARAAAETPPELQRIVSKALRKDREERYQFVKEMVVDLKAVRRELDAGVSSSTMPSPPLGASAVELRTPSPTVTQPAASSAEYLVGEVKRHPWLAFVATAAAVAAIAAAAALFQRTARGRAGVPLQPMRIARLTNSGRIGGAAISADGRYAVFVVLERGQYGIALRQVTTSSTTVIVPPGDEVLSVPVFSRDGDYVYYLKSMGPGLTPNLRSLHRVPTLGGTSQKVIAHVSSGVSFSPDGRKIAFWRLVPGKGPGSLIVAGADGSDEKAIASGSGLAFAFLSGGPQWSPDGTQIAWPVVEVTAAEPLAVIALMPVTGGQERRLSDSSWTTITGFAWLPDGSALLLAGANESTNYRSQIWRVSHPDGHAQPLTSDVSSYAGISLTADGRTLLAVQADAVSRIWVTAPGQTKDAKPIGSGRDDGFFSLSWTPDGRIVHATRDNDIWVMDADGGAARLLTPDWHTNRAPTVSPDGRYVVFESWRGSYVQPPTKDRLWRMDLDGGNPIHLASAGGNPNMPVVTPDGRTVIYVSSTPVSTGSTLPTLGSVSIDGGPPQKLNDRYSRSPAVSPDGTRIAAFYRAEPATPPEKIAVFPITGGEPALVLDAPRGIVAGPLVPLRWMPDGRGVTYTVDRGGVGNLWLQPMDGGSPRQITDFGEDSIFSHAWSPDGRLAVARGTINRDAVLITNFR
jgi:serine/threonine protein kinase/Tol biopolymer transport system component